MQKKCSKKRLSMLLCMVLVVAMALFTGCGKDKQENKNSDVANENVQSEVTMLGEGQTVFTFTVVDKDGNENTFEIHTDKTIVGDALLEHDLIAGDEGDFGLYVKTVNGITADYDADGTYWAFYINGEYAMTGVDSTEVTEGTTYTFKVE